MKIQKVINNRDTQRQGRIMVADGWLMPIFMSNSGIVPEINSYVVTFGCYYIVKQASQIS